MSDLVRRWIDHGLDGKAARERAFGNYMPNVETVVGGSAAADPTIAQRNASSGGG